MIPVPTRPSSVMKVTDPAVRFLSKNLTFPLIRALGSAPLDPPATAQGPTKGRANPAALSRDVGCITQLHLGVKCGSGRSSARERKRCAGPERDRTSLGRATAPGYQPLPSTSP